MALMGIVSRKETEKRLKIMARTMVDMERGLYQWPDNRKPLRPNGTPVVSKAECARVAGYSGTNNQRNMDGWFNDPVYLRELELERARRDVNMDELIAHEENLPLALAKGLFLELLARIKNDPGSISVNNILTFAPQLHRYGLELAARMGELEEGDLTMKGKLDSFNAEVGGQVIDMNPSERARLVASTQAASNDRMAAVRAAVAKANVTEEWADARSDSGGPLAADGTVSS